CCATRASCTPPPTTTTTGSPRRDSTRRPTGRRSTRCSTADLSPPDEGPPPHTRAGVTDTQGRSAVQERPNVWFVMTDQQRWDSMGYAGNDVIETPNLDQLAAEGCWFEHAYSATPSCIPARASLMTGQDPWHTGILGMGEGQGPAQCLENTLPESLSRAGYHTQAVGKLHVHPQRALI